MIALAVTLCAFLNCENTYAQTRIQASGTTTTGASRQVQNSPMVTPVPDFWADSGNKDGATQSEVDRLDRKSLTMVYHYAYEEDPGDFSEQSLFQSAERPMRRSLIHRFRHEALSQSQMDRLK